MVCLEVRRERRVGGKGRGMRGEGMGIITPYPNLDVLKLMGKGIDMPPLCLDILKIKGRRGERSVHIS